MRNRQLRVFLSLFEGALTSIDEPRLYKSERGYQGALLAELIRRLRDANFVGRPIAEQEYQKVVHKHGLRTRPDLIVHVPFDRGVTGSRASGNYVAIELKRKAGPQKARLDLDKLKRLAETLNYPLTLFVNIDHTKSQVATCPAEIAAQTVCFAVRLENGKPIIVSETPPIVQISS